MAKVISPAGTVCTAEGLLLAKLLAAGWHKTDTTQKLPTPKTRRTRTK